MQVDVVLMRSRGTKVPREQLLACAPVRGELGIFPRYDHWSRKRVPMACLQGARMEELLPVLDSVRIVKLSGLQFVLVGQEFLGSHRIETVHRQAWWCRIVESADGGR